SNGGKSTFRSLVPARIDRMPWSRFHWLVVVALGITWILDGLEIQMASGVGEVLTSKGTLHLTSFEVGVIAFVYLIGEVVGALVFGRLSDKLGRRNLFIVTLGIYLLGNGLTALSWDAWSFYVFRFIAGLGIGGEYAAINSAIDELIPARYRGRVDIAVNGTYWAGAAIGAAAQLAFFNKNLFPENLGWRLGFLIGPVIGVLIWNLRKHLPESPRWLMTHGREEEAEQAVAGIEDRVRASGATLDEVDESKAIEVRPIGTISYVQIAKVLFRDFRDRSIVGAVMMITQSFLYNAIFFTYALVLGNFYGVKSSTIPLFFFPFAVGNLLGPLVLGPLFDTIGRRKMILATYGLSGILLAITGFLFRAGALNATTQTILWCVIFFLASAGASSAYLTVSELFPLELRAQAIAFFFAIAQAFGSLGPLIFGALIGKGKDPNPLTVGFVGAAVIMIIGGLVAWFKGVDSEQKSLEEISLPLSVVGGTPGGRTAEA
ncbi:MAG: MFS transporter, partial [Actinomycetes bacterium]